MIDTTRTIEIEGSPVKYIGIIFGCIAFVVLCSLMAFGLMQGNYPAIFVRIVGWVGIVFFVLCAVVSFWRLVTASGPVVTISRDGFRDTRVAAEFVPWRAIRGISTWKVKREQIMVIAIEPAVERTLTLTRIARWTRRANAALGADGLCISTAGLKTDYDTLLSATVGFWRAHGRPA